MTLTILQVIPNLGAGGAEQACVDIAKGLVERGDRALVVSAGGHRVAEAERAGGKHTLCNVHSKNPCVIVKNAFWLARFIREHKVDIAHVRSRAPAWSVWLAVQMVPCRFVSTFHAAYKYSSEFKKFYNRVMARADRIIAISEFIAGYIRESYGIGAEKIRVIPRGIDLTQFEPENVTEDRRAALRDAWHISAEQRVVLMPARLSPIKGHRLLLKVMALLPESVPQVVAVLVGDDQGREGYRRELEDMIRTENLQDRVRLVPHCADMPAAYSLASVAVVPSQVPEGFGRVPVEAMAMGIPVIGSDLGALKETVVHGKTGFLASFDRPEAWKEALLRVLNGSKEDISMISKQSMKRARENFDKQKMISLTLSVYDELMREGA